MTKTRSKRKICFLAHTDFANCLTEWSNSINNYSKIYKSKSICLQPHKFNYNLKHDWDILSLNKEQKKKVLDWILECDHIVLAEEVGVTATSLITAPFSISNTVPSSEQYHTLHMISSALGVNTNILRKLLQGKISIFHSGSIFRASYKVFNAFDNAKFNKVITGADLYRLSNMTEQDTVIYCTYATSFSKKEVYALIDEKYKQEKLLISHTPSKISNKGTLSINKVVSDLLKENKDLNQKYEYRMLTDKEHKEIVALKKKSHICIGEFTTSKEDIGGFGVSSVESAALGNIVLASTFNIAGEAVTKASRGISKPSLGIINIGDNEEKFRTVLLEVLKRETKDLKKLAYNTVNWYYDTSSPEAVCKKLEYEFQR